MREEYGANYKKVYDHHWWWRGREKIVLTEISKLGLPKNANILDFGCGNALFFKPLTAYGNVTGIETDQKLLTDGPFRKQIKSASLDSGEYEAEVYDLITALDVFEHIDDDRAALEKLFRLLKPGGTLLVTVPAHMSLWDDHDEENAHFRRYSEFQLRALLSPVGKIESLRFFNHLIYLPKRLFTLVNRLRTKKISQTTLPPKWVNSLMTRYTYLEYRISPHLRLPFGSSLIALVQKESRP